MTEKNYFLNIYQHLFFQYNQYSYISTTLITAVFIENVRSPKFLKLNTYWLYLSFII